ncbi:PEP-CTERM sorting domain-containing protein [Bowmanella sp. Y26]|uniref:PEP-CTERM sorting domain-containing protein n=1 Tax=Bowmanella yangjiangensis TaxID=2811230 RepID=UPI001BDCEE3E|nr:PEP-CTERM sorting domain-containing protein [Bowmanella yangjiangensis]MBT1065005.1 PEP-CTERM sorting domain-containing protein [Bowmanella yangjiangensis]
MNKIKKLLSTLCLLAAVSTQANAALITQDLIEVASDGSTGIIGSITINTNGALYDPVFGTGEVATAVSFNFLGFDIPPTDILFFQAIFDVNNLHAGLEFLNFDVTFMLPGLVNWAFDGLYETGSLGNYFSVFDLDAGDLAFFNELALGRASVVSEPTTLAMFSLMLAMLGMRRKLQK